jgi:hypothetical protein
VACHAITLVEENLGNAAHSDSADSDEVQLCFLFFATVNPG